MSLLLLGVWGLGLGLLAVTLIQSRVPAGYLTRDPSTTVEEGWYLGALSSLGVVGWAAAAAIFGLGAALAWALNGFSGEATALATGSFLTAVLLIDDLYLVHDDILYRALGSEVPVLAAYAIGSVAWLVTYRHKIGTVAFIPLLAAAIAFAVSLTIDRIWDSDGDWRLVIEDGAKLLGIWSWVAFSGAFTIDRLRIEDARRGPS